VVHEKSHSRDSTVPSNASEGEESEGTSFTEDEDMDGLDDDDDEDKLIMNGGAGIPIGPVGEIRSPNMLGIILPSELTN
jgi:RNA polymerase II subunit A small phosphatase-like protein